jgi:thiamine kinase-like enzyme
MTARTGHPKSSILEEIRKLCGVDIVSIQAAKSAQQEVWILQTKQQHTPRSLTLQNNHPWQDCLRRGSNRLVLRIWKGGCRSWNLNRNHHVASVADSEIMGYRLARKAMQHHPSDVIIPQVLYYSKPTRSATDNHKDDPWAVLEYVGPESQYFDNASYQFDSTYLKGMIIVRHEFGFDEPHPRWGRVPDDQALEYALMVLHQVILPLHRHSRQLVSDDSACTNSTPIRTYAGMVHLYHEAWRDMTAAYKDVTTDERMTNALSLLETAVQKILPGSGCQGVVDNLPPVLVHLDLQPQNILFARNNYDDDDNNNSNSNSNSNCNIRSVLDWEDAAVADPRFELLLLGRKVCATREQAEAIWMAYAMSETTTTNISSLGPLKPWLQLETIHSITTLLLQSMDLLNGGRNPWETKADLWDKLQRDFVRWERLRGEQS